MFSVETAFYEGLITIVATIVGLVAVAAVFLLERSQNRRQVWSVASMGPIRPRSRRWWVLLRVWIAAAALSTLVVLTLGLVGAGRADAGRVLVVWGIAAASCCFLFTGLLMADLLRASSGALYADCVYTAVERGRSGRRQKKPDGFVKELVEITAADSDRHLWDDYEYRCKTLRDIALLEPSHPLPELADPKRIEAVQHEAIDGLVLLVNLGLDRRAQALPPAQALAEVLEAMTKRDSSHLVEKLLEKTRTDVGELLRSALDRDWPSEKVITELIKSANTLNLEKSRVQCIVQAAIRTGYPEDVRLAVMGYLRTRPDVVVGELVQHLSVMAPSQVDEGASWLVSRLLDGDEVESTEIARAVAQNWHVLAPSIVIGGTGLQKIADQHRYLSWPDLDPEDRQRMFAIALTNLTADWSCVRTRSIDDAGRREQAARVQSLASYLGDVHPEQALRLAELGLDLLSFGRRGRLADEVPEASAEGRSPGVEDLASYRHMLWIALRPHSCSDLVGFPAVSKFARIVQGKHDREGDADLGLQLEDLGLAIGREAGGLTGEDVFRTGEVLWSECDSAFNAIASHLEVVYSAVRAVGGKRFPAELQVAYLHNLLVHTVWARSRGPVDSATLARHLRVIDRAAVRSLLEEREFSTASWSELLTDVVSERATCDEGDRVQFRLDLQEISAWAGWLRPGKGDPLKILGDLPSERAAEWVSSLLTSSSREEHRELRIAMGRRDEASTTDPVWNALAAGLQSLNDKDVAQRSSAGRVISRVLVDHLNDPDNSGLMSEAERDSILVSIRWMAELRHPDVDAIVSIASKMSDENGRRITHSMLRNWFRKGSDRRDPEVEERLMNYLAKACRQSGLTSEVRRRNGRIQQA